MKITYHCGARIGQSDDSKAVTVDWLDTDKEIKRALLWSAGRWPESDSSYDGCVWIEDSDGEVVASEDVTVGADGELDFPA